MAEYIDVLREVAGIVNSLAGHGKEAFIWWLVADFSARVVQPVATLAGWVLCVWFVTRAAARIVSGMRFSDEFVLHLRDMARPERIGTEFLNDYDRARLREVAAMMQAHLFEKRAGAGEN